MRATREIIADIKDGKEVPYEELKMACLVQSFLLFQYQNDVKKLLKGGTYADMVKQMWYSDPKASSIEGGISSVYWNGMKRDPIQFLGQAHIPGTPEYEQRYKMSKAVLDAVMKDK
ncbi:MAG: hypothetical protein K2L86_13070 [Lachnospiraceae bacterium]|nr:hypothetical protein [Lachnospiraceae bacterium]